MKLPTRLFLTLALMMLCCRSALASLPEYPGWSNSGFFQLDSYLKIDGERIDALEFVWPNQTGVTSGLVKLGHLGAGGVWEMSNLELRWELISFGRVRIKTARSGELEISPDRKVSWNSQPSRTDEFTEISPLRTLNVQFNFQVTGILQNKSSQNLGFIQLSEPIEIDGQKIDVVQFHRERAVRYFSRGPNGSLKDSGKSGLYDSIIGFNGRYIYFGADYVGGPLWEIDRFTQKVTNPDRSESSYQYLVVAASRTFKLARAPSFGPSCQQLFSSNL